MIEIPITKIMLDYANHKAYQLGKLKNSITKGEGNIAGFLGEIATKMYLNIPYNKEENSIHYDVIHNNIRIDVKTKRTTTTIKPYYETSIANLNTLQDCDDYLFTRVYQPTYSNMPISVFLLGIYPKDLYFEKARFLSKGDIDGDNNYIVKSDCWNMTIDELYNINY